MGLIALVRKIETKFDRIEDAGLTVFLSVLLVLSFVLLPLVVLEGSMRFVVSGAYTLLFVLGAFLGDLGPRWRAFAMLLGLATILIDWAQGVAPGVVIDLANLTASVVFMMLVCTAMLRQVFRPGEINSHRFRGAIAAYLLIGYIFALVFVMVENSAPGAFHGMTTDTRDHLFRDAVYFSFVTLATLGYGDITPASEVARSLAIIEAIVGQLFIAILIGRLISLSVANARRPSE